MKMFTSERLYGRTAVLNTGYQLSSHFRLTANAVHCLSPNIVWERLNTKSLNAQLVFT